MKKKFTVADINNVISALTCYITKDFDATRTINDITHTVNDDKNIIDHLTHCMNIIDDYNSI